MPGRRLASAAAIAACCAAMAVAAAGDPSGAGAAKACGVLPRANAATTAELMAGQLTIAPFPAVTIDPGRDGDMNWAINPFDNPTWAQYFRSSGWIENLIASALAGGPQANAYLAGAKRIAAGWLRALPPSGRDPQTLVCIARAFPGQAPRTR